MPWDNSEISGYTTSSPILSVVLVNVPRNDDKDNVNWGKSKFTWSLSSLM